MFIPGPATLMTMARAVSSGPRAGIATGAGIAVGDLVHTALAALGNSALLATSALAFVLVKYAGAAYLVYLGLRSLCGRTPSRPGAAPRIAPARAFRQAVLAEMLNPKAAVFFLAFLPQFFDPAAGAPMLQLLTLGAVFVVLGFAATLVFALGAGGLGGGLTRRAAAQRALTRLTGSIYCAIGVRLALAER